MIFRQHLSLLLWSVTQTVKLGAQFFVNPAEEYDKYIAKNTTDGYLKSSSYLLTQIMSLFNHYLIVLTLSFQLLQWWEIRALIAVQRKHQTEIIDLQRTHFH